MSELHHVAIYLAAAVVCVAVMKRLGFAAVLGYLVAGVLIGPWTTGLIDDVESAAHLAEFGVVLLLFVIGLELQPARLWALRRPIFGMGSAQLLVTASALSAVAFVAGFGIGVALVIGFGLAMSSTAFVLQLLAEKKELPAHHGRASFAILLFQDIAVIPLLAVVPLLASSAALDEVDPLGGLLRLALVCGGLFLASRFLLRPVFQLVARSGVSELFTATALLVVVATTVLMEAVGLSATLGAFLAGVLLADSEYRHELEARLHPFEGLLLGLFFISVGMSADLGLLAAQPGRVFALVLTLMVIKFAVLLLVGRAFRLAWPAATRLAAVLCQGGEFAFILFGLAREVGVIEAETAALLIVVVTLSMALTPVAYALTARLLSVLAPPPAAPAFEMPQDDGGAVVIAGFGRFGTVVGRILRALRIPFTALDINPEQVEMVRQYGQKAYYGNATDLDLLHAAGLGRARALVLALDDAEASLKLAELTRRHFPAVRIFARARDRHHWTRLKDLDVAFVERELYHSSLRLSEELLIALGMHPRGARRAVITFRAHDETALERQRRYLDDQAGLVQTAKEAATELAALFDTDTRFDPRALSSRSSDTEVR
ncbi:MAG: monovalent cation:proton antiporter-2 (CPA2) family protein [Gammaproteobacteria bacterium]